MSNNGRIVWERFTSRVLANNPWNDPTTRDLPIYLPPGYASDEERRYPVVYGLTGFTGAVQHHLVVVTHVHADHDPHEGEQGDDPHQHLAHALLSIGLHSHLLRVPRWRLRAR